MEAGKKGQIIVGAASWARMPLYISIPVLIIGIYLTYKKKAAKKK